MAFVLLRAPQGGASSDLVTSSVVIPTTATGTVDSVASTSLAVKWFVSVENNTTTENAAYEIYAQNRGGTVSWNRSSTLGDEIDHDIVVAISGPNLELQITNNEANSITVRAVRILVF